MEKRARDVPNLEDEPDPKRRRHAELDDEEEEEKEEEKHLQVDQEEQKDGDEPSLSLDEAIDLWRIVHKAAIPTDPSVEDLEERMDIWRAALKSSDADDLENTTLNRMKRLYPLIEETPRGLQMMITTMGNYIFRLSELRKAFDKIGIFGEDPTSHPLSIELDALGNIIRDTYDIRRGFLSQRFANNPGMLQALPYSLPQLENLRKPVDQKDRTPHDSVKVLDFIFNYVSEKNYRFFQDSFYKAIYDTRIDPVTGNSTLFYTYAWKRVKRVSTIVQECYFPKKDNPQIYEIVTRCHESIEKNIKSQFEEGRDPRVVKLNKRDGSWSFKNGIYIGIENRFYTWERLQVQQLPSDFATIQYFPIIFEKEKYDMQIWNKVFTWEEEEEIAAREAEQEHKKHQSYPSFENNDNAIDEDYLGDIDAAPQQEPQEPGRFSDMPVLADDELDAAEAEARRFINEFEWFKIKTPNIDQIFNTQKLSKEVQAWVWILLGRLLFANGDHDQWQVMPFFQGIAGSGKSTLLKLIHMLFDPKDVGIVKNTYEQVFGAQSLYKKKVILGMDVGKNLRLDQAELQSWISAEQCIVSIKNKEAVMIDAWTAPIAFSGNNLPNWKDNAGSISRRFIIIEFNYPVKKTDAKLEDKIRSNLGAIIKKMVMAYMSAVRLYSDVGLWSVLPKEFHDAANRLRKTTNALFAFVSSKHVETNKNDNGQRKGRGERFISFDDFEDAFKAFCQDKNYAIHKLTHAYTCDVFSRFDITENNNYTPPFSEGSGHFLIGCDLSSD